MPKVTFLPSGIEVDCNDGDSLFHVGRDAGVDISTACVGAGTCGQCRVRVVEGEQFLSPPDEVDERHLGNTYFITRLRLSCRARVSGGPVTVEVAGRRERKGSSLRKK